MVVFKDLHIFVNDFVSFNHPALGNTVGKVNRIITKVGHYNRQLHSWPHNYL